MILRRVQWQVLTSGFASRIRQLCYSTSIAEEQRGGNQRELARLKNIKKSQEQQKKKGANEKDGNKGMSLEERRHRDAEQMREKQRLAKEKEAASGNSNNADSGNKNKK
ncbi:unnamed protein product [Darwinula stevensoni]|uniref:Small EDRK-rich factor-like N-terminal domain-containing protein n=1 Tax=Darwinula stevensoni TaxID=69355 RepID=A0A7R8X770_9CRUS|nr:unnamed protein product [Darwinula stevensoni]CAG0886651.1 unnamed protein product [Darwinula stevensoni]